MCNFLCTILIGFIIGAIGVGLFIVFSSEIKMAGDALWGGLFSATTLGITLASLKDASKSSNN